MTSTASSTTLRAEEIRETTGVAWEIACQMAERERDLPPAPRVILGHLVAQQQSPRVEPMHDGCYVLSFAHRGRPGRGYVYCAPGGSWTHDAKRAAQLAERFPLR